MPRQLPWEVNGTPKVAAQRRKTTERLAPSKPRAGPSGSKKPTSALGRSPSTSPPPEPPKEEFMIEGPENDDRYRMVEDEFLAVASEFTRHLHAAEYHRLRAATKSRNAKTIQSVSRPVTGEMTDSVRRRHIALRVAAKQRDGLAKLRKRSELSVSDDEEREEEMPWAGTSLQGLMDGPQKKATSLAGLTSSLGLPTRATTSVTDSTEYPTSQSGGSGSTTNPASRARYGDGLNHPADAVSPTARHGHSVSEDYTAKISDLPSKNLSKLPGRLGNHPSDDSMTAMNSEEEPEDDGDDDLFASLRHRREQRRRREQRAKKEKSNESTSLDEIPLF